MAILPYSIRGDEIDWTDPWNAQYLQESSGTQPVGISMDFKETGMDSMSGGDEPIDHTELIEKSAFLGEYPYDTIAESITDQFNDYIGSDDRTNYVDIFYEQLHASISAVNDDIGEEHPSDIKDALDIIHDRFISLMKNLLEQRLSITIMTIDSEEFDRNQIEYAFRRLYEFFILNAKHNFLTVISKDINSKMKTVIEDDREYYRTIRNMLTAYSPFVTEVGPMEFLKYCNNQEVYELFEDGKVSGNFLRKYSPKLYQYEEFEVEIITHITMVQQVKEELLYGKQ